MAIRLSCYSSLAQHVKTITLRQVLEDFSFCAPVPSRKTASHLEREIDGDGVNHSGLAMTLTHIYDV